MRRIVAGLFMSLDGVVESPEKWQSPYFNNEMEPRSEPRWPPRTRCCSGGGPTRSSLRSGLSTAATQGPRFMNNMPKLVVSTTPDAVEWQYSKVVQDDVVATISEPKAQPGKDVLVTGSVTLVRSLLRYGLLDELAVMVCPVLSGAVCTSSRAHPRVAMTLVDSRTFANGVVNLTYQPESD